MVPPDAPASIASRTDDVRRVCLRLFLTVAIVYAIHFAPNVVRETYLAVAVAERFSIAVDGFEGLHPDIFEMPGRGTYINNNPGASFIAAVPYALARPALELLYRARPGLVAPKPPAAYDDPRPNRTKFMNEMRARGLDVRLALAAAIIHLGLNAPLGGLAAVAMFLFLRARSLGDHAALWLSLLFAFGTPLFFRSAFLNQNLLLAYCTFFAYLALNWPNALPVSAARWRPAAAGGLLGLGLLCDYSALPLLVVFAAWVSLVAIREAGTNGAVRSLALFTAGAAGPIAMLLLYQYAAFGNAWLPAQAYMPDTELSVSGWHGVRLPHPDLLWRNLLDPGYGLLVFCPMLIASVLAPRYRHHSDRVPTRELVLIFGATLALYAFSSAIAFAALQWNTGVRYLVPAAPLLFIALVPVLRHSPRWAIWALVVPTLTISWCVAMARESVPASLLQVFVHGPSLPWHTVLEKTAAAYLPALSGGGTPIAVFLLAGVVLWLLWTRAGDGIRNAT